MWTIIPAIVAFLTPVSSCVARSQATDGVDAPRAVFSYPRTPFIDIENIAVRSNGQLLLNYITSSTTYLLDPAKSPAVPELIYSFPGTNSTAGITETTPDVFAVIAGNYSTSAFQGTWGSFAVWTIDLRRGLPGTLKKVASIPDAHGLNGATVLPSAPYIVLIADSSLGVIWSVDTSTGAFSQIIQESGLDPSSTFLLGVNGIKVYQDNLYFTNSAQRTYARIPIDPATGAATGPVTILATLPEDLTAYDDFAMDSAGNAWVTAHDSSLYKISTSGDQTLVYGPDAALLNEPTSAAFGRGSPAQECLLYVVTAGSAGESSGQVLALNTC
ncbi:hypothetical protein BJX62DRAFT_244400 [Aspergillus germanicus]